jgi:hypothetical protein
MWPSYGAQRSPDDGEKRAWAIERDRPIQSVPGAVQVVLRLSVVHYGWSSQSQR